MESKRGDGVGGHFDSEEPNFSSSSEGSPKHNQKYDGWTTLLLLASATTTLGSSIPAGYNIGVVNTPANIIKTFCYNSASVTYSVSLTDIQLDILWSCVVSIFIVGGVVGSLTGGWLADRFGRKGSIIISDVLGVFAALFFILSRQVSSIEVLLLGRLLVGLSSGLTTAIVPMYLTELSPLRLRGATGVMCPLGLTIGVLFAQVMGLQNVLGTEPTWHYLLALYALLILISATALPILPESPKYLSVIRRQEQRAVKELVRIRGRTEEELREEVDLLKGRSVEEGAGQEKQWSSGRLFTEPRLRLPLFLVCSLQAGQQFSGINAVFYYSTTIFESAGLSESEAQYANLGAGCMNLLIGIISIYTVNHFGRRPLAIISCSGAAFFLCILTISITFIKTVPWMSYVSIASVLSYVLIYGLGLGPIPYFLGSELFEVGPRPVAMAWGSMANWGGNFIVGITFPSLQRLMGQYAFLIFVVIVLFLLVFLVYYLPETKDRDDKEIASVLQYGFKSSLKRQERETMEREERLRERERTNLPAWQREEENKQL